MPLALWLAAVCVEYTSGGLAPSAGLTVVSAAHWAERYALILLIALGESIISLGLGTEAERRLAGHVAGDRGVGARRHHHRVPVVAVLRHSGTRAGAA
ncbi:low temperature requirement protein A, partial [Micromonospora sp. M42]|uniref:low temperature requirement protein A n=1 Tax=Micromonospora sp. M42 TaxID=457406 RepID=UPI0035109145